MGLIIDVADFVGQFEVAKNNYSKLANYIDRYEVKYLRELFGADLYSKFIADFGLPSQDPIYGVLYDEFYQDFSGIIIESRGIKDMLLGFIYFEYMRENNIKTTTTGLVMGAAENSTPAKPDDNYIYSRYNQSVETHCAIQWKIMQTFKEDYPTYNGKKKRLAYWCL